MDSSLTYVLQIFTGGFNANSVTYKDIEDKLNTLLGTLPIRLVIAGWQINIPLYKQLKNLLLQYDIPLFLWFPVFSEIGDVVDGDPIVLYTGRKTDSVNLNEGEGFEFLCPTSLKNQKNVIKVFNENFDADSYDGVFLDRIRYPSFSNGYKSIFSCFCPRCTKLMEDAGLPIDWIKERIVCAEENQLQPFSVEQERFPYNKLTNRIWRDFFDFKHANITKAMLNIIKHFRDLKMQVGLDVFAPSITDFIGQDVVRLSKLADFIKPMMYYKTFAPGGIYYEKIIFQTGFGSKLSKLALQTKDQEYDAHALNEMVNRCNCDIYPGFEVNRIEKIAETSIEYIREQIEEYKQIESISSVVLSWNLLDMPSEHIKFIIEST